MNFKVLLEREVWFEFLGHRHYSHGSSMLRHLLSGVCDVLDLKERSGLWIKQFKIIKEFDCQARMLITSFERLRKVRKLSGAVARLDVSWQDQDYVGLLLPRPDEPIKNRRSEYNAENYVSGVRSYPDGSESAAITGIEDEIDLLRAVVEGNRQLVLADSQMPEGMDRIRWAYVKGVAIPSVSQCVLTESVYFRPNKFIPTGGSQYFAIRQFSLNIWSEGNWSEIGFFMENTNKPAQ